MHLNCYIWGFPTCVSDSYSLILYHQFYKILCKRIIEINILLLVFYMIPINLISIKPCLTAEDLPPSRAPAINPTQTLVFHLQVKGKLRNKKTLIKLIKLLKYLQYNNPFVLPLLRFTRFLTYSSKKKLTPSSLSVWQDTQVGFPRQHIIFNWMKWASWWRHSSNRWIKADLAARLFVRTINFTETLLPFEENSI